MKNRRRFFALLACLSIVSVAGSGCGSEAVVTPMAKTMREYTVKIATATGEWIEERATTLAEAIRLAWRKVFPEVLNDVEVDPENPHRGIFRGKYEFRVVRIAPDGKSVEVLFRFTDPLMVRESTESPWDLDPANYPNLLE